MCGIVGYIGKKNAVDILIDGLKNWSIGAMIHQGSPLWMVSN